MKRAVIYGLALLLLSCHSRQTAVEQATSTSNIRYAKGFRISKQGSATKVTVVHPFKGATTAYEFLLVPKGETPPEHGTTPVIEVPVERIVCTSTTHIPHLDYLGVSDRLVGFPSTDYISSPTMRARIDSGKVTDLGIDNGMNLEVLYTLHPDLVMGYTMTADLGQLRKIRDLGVPVVINSEYLEGDPLGRAEWIKFTALFFGKEKEADSIFRTIENEYLATKKLLATATTRPTILYGTVYGDAWFMPGGNNYAAHLFSDASIEYLWASDSTNGWLEISFEAVYDRAKNANLWIVGSFNSLDELRAADSRYALFAPFRDKHVYNYNAKVSPLGGNEFLESGYVRPDIILKDLGKIAHPELLPDYQLFYHAKVRD